MAWLKLALIGLVGVLAFWLNDIINSFIIGMVGGPGSIFADPIIMFIMNVVLFFFELISIGWIILKVPAVARKF